MAARAATLTSNASLILNIRFPLAIHSTTGHIAAAASSSIVLNGIAFHAPPPWLLSLVPLPLPAHPSLSLHHSQWLALATASPANAPFAQMLVSVANNTHVAGQLSGEALAHWIDAAWSTGVLGGEYLPIRLSLPDNATADDYAIVDLSTGALLMIHYYEVCEPLFLPNGLPLASPVPVGDDVALVCNNGYELVGAGSDGLVTCTADGTYQPQTPACRPVPDPPDAGPCPGLAIRDTCGVCSGPGTAHIADSDLDACGVCFGANAALDDCGVCFGNNAAKDACGVCFGDGSRCAGCDGVPHSGLLPDVCGLCGGDGTSCLGCNGIPIPSGDAVFDGCGVCGGPGTVGSCGATCNASAPLHVSYDCAGVCGGSAYIDSCGACVGGITGKRPEYARDGCGVCWGGNSSRDACGVCGGGGTDIDDCGVCFGNNSEKDECGRCWGNNAFHDLCGVCNGSATTCAGCDFVIGSKLRIDDCGVCGGQGDCHSTRILGMPSMAVALTTAVMLFCVLAIIGLGTAVLLLARRRRRAKVAATAAIRKAALAEAPHGELILMVTHVVSASDIWAAMPAAMYEAMLQHDICLRQVISEYDGYEIASEHDSFVVAFPASEAISAVHAAIAIHDRMVTLAWPRVLLTSDLCPTVVAHTGLNVSHDGSLCHTWRGLRLRIGIHACLLTRSYSPASQGIEYAGPGLAHTSVISQAAPDGAVVVTREVLACLPSTLPAHLSIECVDRVVSANGDVSFDIFAVSAQGSVTTARKTTGPVASSHALAHSESGQVGGVSSATPVHVSTTSRSRHLVLNTRLTSTSQKQSAGSAPHEASSTSFRSASSDDTETTVRSRSRRLAKSEM
ncbi:uncharacterized protein AMSG_10263 [Thecamonas trahens ATCC 50062]|uniref:Sushi domain-containing protein n=1 Tax=Thecamonas trahens ATCC 50062 TaxID=461836 RepID=A0A0L0DPQ0_THETB|nr:hypothetical protein AMSG_10263 [Thecamonas trahens ATCC 50062]KNC54284.1 hypothetical protein AMSG_10263 [Thecamonas trahens ATCC 50062]|eukprot:XP_013753749.1 hypothetical protein AMSG_10263 [Thecamonas trahens ATCC 50062]